MNETLKRVYTPLPPPEWVPTPANRRLRRAKAEMAGVIEGIIAARAHRSSGCRDLLDMLLEARDDPKAPLAPRHVADMVTTLLLAAHETTANALSWTWFQLARHPNVVARLHDELAGVLGGRAPTTADLPRLVYTRMVIEEAMRLLPPVWVLDRRAAEDDVVGGFRIEAGTMVILAPWLTHRHPDFWDDPDSFDPERFRPEAVAARHPFAYFPFAAGPRGCIGENFALVETVLMLATLAQRFAPALVPGRWPVPEPSLTLRPRDGLWMRIREIERAEARRAAS